MFLNNKTHVFKCMYQTPPRFSHTHTHISLVPYCLFTYTKIWKIKIHKIKNPNSTFHLRATSSGATILRSKQRLEKYIWTHEHEIPSPRFHSHFRNSLIVFFFFPWFIVFHKKYKNFNWVSTNNTTFHSFLFHFIHFFFPFMNSKTKC